MDDFTDVELKMLEEALTLLNKDVYLNRSEYTKDEIRATNFLFGSVHGEQNWRGAQG